MFSSLLFSCLTVLGERDVFVGLVKPRGMWCDPAEFRDAGVVCVRDESQSVDATPRRPLKFWCCVGCWMLCWRACSSPYAQGPPKTGRDVLSCLVCPASHVNVPCACPLAGHHLLNGVIISWMTCIGCSPPRPRHRYRPFSPSPPFEISGEQARLPGPHGGGDGGAPKRHGRCAVHLEHPGADWCPTKPSPVVRPSRVENHC